MKLTKEKILEMGWGSISGACIVSCLYGARTENPILLLFSVWIMSYVIYGVRIND